jgi:hypothetical protein
MIEENLSPWMPHAARASKGKHISNPRETTKTEGKIESSKVEIWV